LFNIETHRHKNLVAVFY